LGARARRISHGQHLQKVSLWISALLAHSRKLKFDRKLGPFALPQPRADYPIDYVLDGQQRVTSIYGVFQSDLPPPGADENWLPIYFDLSVEPTAQDSQFAALPPDKVDPEKHFPLSTLFSTVAYRKANEGLKDEVIEKIDKMQEIFKEVKIPIQTSTTEDKATVAIIFERVNRQGVELDTLQLLSAWTWSEDFQLQDQFAELADELTPFGFEEVGGDTNLLLRCCSAILKGDASPQALMSINGADVRNEFDKVTGSNTPSTISGATSLRRSSTIYHLRRFSSRSRSSSPFPARRNPAARTTREGKLTAGSGEPPS